MLVNIGLECVRKTAKNSIPKQPCKHALQPLIMTSWQFPSDLPPAAKPYILSETSAIVTWVHDLHDERFPVQRWSWWQLFLDAWLTIPNLGPWYHVQQKQWKAGTTQPPEPFLRKARWFSKYMNKLSVACDIKLPLEHASPQGTVIAFWTATLPVRVSMQRTETLDTWLGQYLPCASKTSDLRKIHM